MSLRVHLFLKVFIDLQTCCRIDTAPKIFGGGHLDRRSKIQTESHPKNSRLPSIRSRDHTEQEPAVPTDALPSTFFCEKKGNLKGETYIGNMPVTKKKPNISELLAIAVKRHKELLLTTTEILERPASIWFTDKNSYSSDDKSIDNLDADFGSTLQRSMKAHMNSVRKSFSQSEIFKPRICNNSYAEKFNQYFIQASRYCKIFLETNYARVFSTCLYIFASVVMCMQVEQEDLSHDSSQIEILDHVVNALVLSFSLIRLLSIPISVKIEHAFHRKIGWTKLLLIESGVVTLILTIICFSLKQSVSGLWFRLVRMIFLTTVFFESIPIIAVIASGMINGLKSILFAILLFFIVIVFYASLGHALFSDNDPYNFGSLAISVVAFFQMSTFENWTTIYYLNSGGCDNYNSVYTALPYNTSQMVTTYWGTFELPLCKTPVARPIESVLIFVSFTFIAGYLLVNTSLAAVAIGFKERLRELKTMKTYGNDSEQTVHFKASHKKKVHNQERRGSINNKKAASMFGVANESKVMMVAMKQIWGEQLTFNRSQSFRFEMEKKEVGFKFPRNVQELVQYINLAIKYKYYDFFMTCMMCIDGIIQLVTASRDFEDQASDSAHIFFQLVFSIDLALRSSLFYQKKSFNVGVLNFWFLFEMVLTVLTWIPTVVDTNSSLRPMGTLRLLRILKVLKNFSFLTDLSIILGAFESSLLSMIYIVFLLCLMYFIFAVAGVLLFKLSSPYHFGGIGSSLFTLSQMMTQDNWSEIMRVCMYGCTYYGYDTGLKKFDGLCKADQKVTLSEVTTSDRTPGSGVGWVAPIFFIIFIISSAMVLISLLVGVMITSMELLREEVTEGKDVWDKVNVVKNRYSINEDNMEKLLELFEKLDTEVNGQLTYQELQPIMDLIDMQESHHFEFFMRVDSDGSGQIDFSEFCEMIVLIGIARAEMGSHKDSMVSKRLRGMINRGGEASAVVALEHGNKKVTDSINSSGSDHYSEKSHIEGIKHAAQELHFLKAIVDAGSESGSSDEEAPAIKQTRVKPSHSTVTTTSSSVAAAVSQSVKSMSEFKDKEFSNPEISFFEDLEDVV